MMLLLPELVFDGDTLRPDMGVLVEGERIVAVLPRAEAVRRAENLAATVEALPRRALLPGFVNAHSHAFQRGLRGHVQYAEGGDSFWTWRERMYTLANSLTPEGMQDVARLAFREMLAAGFTTVGEFHYVHHQPDGTPYADPDELAHRVVAAAEDVGIRVVLLRVAYARAGFEVPFNPLQRRFLDTSPDAALDAVARLRARGIAAGLAPHSMRACPIDWLRAFRAAGLDVPVHAHVDEQPGEVAASLREHGQRPLHVFGEAGLLSERFTAVHLTHPDAEEIALLRATRAGVCACPSTELDLGDGFLPLASLDGDPLDGPPPVSIGSDSHARIDPFGELAMLEGHARALAGRRNVLRHAPSPDALSARLLRMGTEVGARQLGLDTGRIAAGALADLVAIDLDHVALEGARPLPAIVFAGSPALVREVWVGGVRRR
jgi:formimidoylglutamate deiminase